MSTDVFTSISASVGGGFIGGLLTGYALKKVIKIIAAILGLFMAGLAYYLSHIKICKLGSNPKRWTASFFSLTVMISSSNHIWETTTS
jgi:uncharacterized membrane protein (Fun14 family)